jgi:hypothetical protein
VGIDFAPFGTIAQKVPKFFSLLNLFKKRPKIYSTPIVLNSLKTISSAEFIEKNNFFTTEFIEKKAKTFTLY